MSKYLSGEQWEKRVQARCQAKGPDRSLAPGRPNGTNLPPSPWSWAGCNWPPTCPSPRVLRCGRLDHAAFTCVHMRSLRMVQSLLRGWFGVFGVSASTHHAL